MPKNENARNILEFLGPEESASDDDGMPGLITIKDSRVPKKRCKEKAVKKDMNIANAEDSCDNKTAAPYGPFGVSSDILKDWIQRQTEP